MNAQKFPDKYYNKINEAVLLIQQGSRIFGGRQSLKDFLRKIQKSSRLIFNDTIKCNEKNIFNYDLSCSPNKSLSGNSMKKKMS